MTNEVSNASGRERGHKEVHLKAKGKRKKKRTYRKTVAAKEEEKNREGKEGKRRHKTNKRKRISRNQKKGVISLLHCRSRRELRGFAFFLLRTRKSRRVRRRRRKNERTLDPSRLCVCVCACAAASLWPVSASVRPLLCLSLLLSSLAPHLPLHVGRHPLNRTQRVRTSFEKTILCVCVRSGLVRGVYLLKNQHECFPSPSYGALFRTVSARFLCGWFCLSHGGQTPALTSSFLCLLRTHRPHSCPSSVCEVDSGSLFTFLVADLIFPFFFWRLHVSHKQVWGFFSAVVYLLFLLLCKCSCVCVCVCVCA